jgi:hypothetical protein
MVETRAQPIVPWGDLCFEYRTVHVPLTRRHLSQSRLILLPHRLLTPNPMLSSTPSQPPTPPPTSDPPSDVDGDSEYIDDGDEDEESDETIVRKKRKRTKGRKVRPGVLVKRNFMY